MRVVVAAVNFEEFIEGLTVFFFSSPQDPVSSI